MKAFELKQPEKHLVIFDIDDTLFHTTAQINVVKDGQVVRSLSNREFNNYTLKPGEVFDFGEFRDAEKFKKESIPIEPMLNKLKAEKSAGHDVVMLTARADLNKKGPVYDKFLDNGIDIYNDVHLYRAGNLPGHAKPADKKAEFITKWLSSGKYTHATMYDDSEANLNRFKSLKNEFPEFKNIKFVAHHVSPEGNTRQIEQNILEKKRRGKKIKAAAYGPGPYGWYGFYPGYSGEAPTSGDGGGDGGVGEAWSEKYKHSINCNNPKGFSQRAHCQGRKKHESVHEDLEDSKNYAIEMFEKFLPLAIDILNLKSLPEFVFLDNIDPDGQPTFGVYKNDEKTLYVALMNRHPNDILRTIAHELTHYKQDIEEMLDSHSGQTGSKEENQANALAGIIMRNFNKLYPEYLKSKPLIKEGTETEIYNYTKLDTVLVNLCKLIIKGQETNSKKYGMVGAALIGPNDEITVGTSTAGPKDSMIHAERVAIDRYLEKYGEIPDGAIIVTTLSPCSEPMDDRYLESCTDLINNYNIKKVYAGYMDPTQDEAQRNFNIIETVNKDIKGLCKRFADTFLNIE